MNGYTASHTGTESSRTYLSYISKGGPRYLWEHTESQLLRGLLKGRPENHLRLLDLACGNGRAGSALVDVASTVIGVDYSAEQMNHLVNDEILLSRGDACHLPFSNDAFDVVVTLRFYSNAEDALRVGSLREVNRVLASEGVLLCSVHNVPRTLPNLARQLARVIRHKNQPRWISRRIVERQFADAGFMTRQRISYGLIGSLRSRGGLRALLLPALGYDLYVLSKRRQK